MSKSTGVDVQIQASGGVVIAVSGKFDFHVHESFQNAYESVDRTATEWTVDLSDVDYMDSSALGMLLLLKEHAARTRGEDNATVRVANCTPEVRNILQISNFDRLFDVD